MQFRKIIAVTLASLSLAGAGLTTSASAAPAASTPHRGWPVEISVGQGRAACPQYFLCIWTGHNYTGSGRGYGGSITHGEWTSWFNSETKAVLWENNVHSAVNQTTIPVRFLDIHGVVGIPVGDLYPGYNVGDDWSGANKVDGMIYPDDL
ncbi:peptidase inhibitor family I36 protein [Streptomyces sp. Agncl-13]|uniref:peptidase inhibitor family I36 protein n=1 Tax=Streptomyces sp. Agncl-13 TaxID=3400628 RepID=UPI003A897657